MVETRVVDFPECYKKDERMEVPAEDLPQAGWTAESLEANGVMEMLKTRKSSCIPDWYIKPPHLRATANSTAEESIPVVDLSCASRQELVRATARGCEWGFFQVLNHGLPANLLNKILDDSTNFFALPTAEKTMCTTAAKVAGPVHFGGGTKGDWRDVLKLNCAPSSAVAMEHWPLRPASFRETILGYCSKQQALAHTLLELINESLGLDKGYIDEVLGADRRVLLAINHYPPCPDPSLTMGIREHSDPNTITILLQDSVAGLQVHKDGRWIDLKPVGNALVVNVGDHLQILSNGRYRSCVHRVVNNKSTSRTSIATFYSPSLTSTVGPAPGACDDENPPKYRTFTYSEFLRDFYGSGGPNKQVILSHFQTAKTHGD